MNFHPLSSAGAPLRPLALTLALVAAFACFPAHAEDEAVTEEAPAQAVKKDRMTELLDKLKEKNVIDDEEYKTLSGDTPEGRAEARAQRRQQALRKAQEIEKEAAAANFMGLRWNNGLTAQTADGKNSVSLSGRIHTDYRAFSDDTAASTFDIRRAYLGLSGKVNGWITWDVTGDFAQSTTTLDVGWVNLAFSDAAQLRFGQFKMPMTIEELTSSRFIDFQERSLVNRLAPAKERGIMLHGVPTAGVTYAIAVSNGQGKNTNETSTANDKPDLIGRVSVNIAEILGSQASNVYHLAVSGSQGTQPASMTFNSTTEPRGARFFDLAAGSFTGAGVDRQRMGFEASLAQGPLKFQAEWLSANYSGTNASRVAFDRNIETYYVSLLWMVTGERYAESYRNGTYGRIVPYSIYSPGGTGTGAFELGLRYSGFNASDFKLNNAAGTGVLTANSGTTRYTNGAETLTLQAKWIATPNLRFIADYTETRFDTPIRVSGEDFRKEKAFTMRAAFDF